MAKNGKCIFCSGGKKEAFIFERTSERNSCTALLVMFLFMFTCLCALSMIINSMILDILTIGCITFEVLLICRLCFSYYEEKKYRFRIRAVRMIKNRFVEYHVYSDKFLALKDGTFDSGLNTRFPYHSEGNDILDQYILRNSSQQFDFYLDVYDRKNKVYLSDEEIIANYMDKKDE